MHPLLRGAALALALHQAAAVTAELAAQGKEGLWAVDPACPLVTEKEVEAATGLDDRPGNEIEQEYEWIDGGETCLWGGPSMVHARAEVTPSSGTSNSRGRSAPASRCLASATGRSPRPARAGLFGVSVYARSGNDHVVVRMYHLKPMLKASVKPAAIAPAKAAAARVKGM